MSTIEECKKILAENDQLKARIAELEASEDRMAREIKSLIRWDAEERFFHNARAALASRPGKS